MASTNSYFNTNPFHSPKGPNGELPSNPIDYDFNINAIKTLLMTSKVPESCVWSVMGGNETKKGLRPMPIEQSSRIGGDARHIFALPDARFANLSAKHWATAQGKGPKKVVSTITFPCLGSASAVRCRSESPTLMLHLVSISHPISMLIYWQEGRKKYEKKEAKNFSPFIYWSFVNKLVNIIE